MEWLRWRGGRARTGGNSLCGDTPGSEHKEAWSKGEGRRSSRDVGGPPLPLLPDLGDPHQLSPSLRAVLVSLLSPVEEEVDSMLWCPEERAGIEAVRIEP